MNYSIFSLLALILNTIINNGAFRYCGIKSDKPEAKQRAIIRYAHFLIAANCYFVVDIGWGILYQYHHIPAVFPILYSDCVFYFIFMFLTMLTWIRYIVAYLDKRRRRTKILLFAVWSMFWLGMINLMINRFHPFIFSFNENHEYVPEPGRHIAFVLQITLYLVTMVYMFYISRKANGGERFRYIAVGLTCIVMDIFLVMQILNPAYPSYAMGLIISICVIHSFVEASEKREKEIYDHIASGLAEDYEAMYYIDIETGEYMEFATSKEYESMNVPVEGKNFYEETKLNVEKYVHPDDRVFAENIHTKENMLKNLVGKNSYSYKYRIMMNGEPKYFRFTVMRANDGKHFVLYEKDIDDEITVETMLKENQKKQVTFSQIAESLASNYDVLYYVDVEDSSYISFECHNIYGQLDIQRSGDEYFEDSKADIAQIVHKNDRDLVLGFVNRDNMISNLRNSKERSIDYRIMAGRKTHYVRMTARKTGDGSHFIIGIENIDAEVKKEKQHLKALNTEKELARRDELTGIKNKTAYTELEKSVQAEIDKDADDLKFALVVCDANNLKQINDSEGHSAGDKYIRESAMILCDIFDHSPVFRVGGDEFVVFLSDSDYSNRDELMKSLRDRIRENQRTGEGPIMASGMAEYDPEEDSFVSEVFDRADKEMYEDKQDLKKTNPFVTPYALITKI